MRWRAATRWCSTPISVTGDGGINLAAGIADLDLNYVGTD
jgi:hypothetical protein